GGQPLVGRELDDPDRAEDPHHETDDGAVKAIAGRCRPQAMQILTGDDDPETDDERDEPEPLFESEPVDRDGPAVGGGDRNGAEPGNEEDGREHGAPETPAPETAVRPIRGCAVRAGSHCSGVVSATIYGHRFDG